VKKFFRLSWLKNKRPGCVKCEINYSLQLLIKVKHMQFIVGFRAPKPPPPPDKK